MLYLLDYGAGNVTSLGASILHALTLPPQLADPWLLPGLFSPSRSSLRAANSVRKLGFEFKWVRTPEDIDKADVRPFPSIDRVPWRRCESGGRGSSLASLHTLEILLALQTADKLSNV